MKILLLLLLPFLLVSCFQEEEIYTLNPDGSGKVEFKVTLPLDSTFSLNADGDGGKEPSPEQKAKKAVAEILKKSEGVAAWANVSYKINDDGKLEFQGTAYFRDLNKLELSMGNIDSKTLKPTLTKKNGLVTVECSLMKDEDGAAKPKSGKAKPKWAEMTEKQQKLAMAKARQGLNQMKGMLAGIAGDMSTKVVIHLPAPAKKSSGFKELTAFSYTVTQTGEMMLKGIDKVLANEKMMQQLAGEFDLQENPPEEVIHQMFGYSENPAVSFPATAAPAFDYKKELQAAQKAAPAMMKKLGLTATPVAPMAGEAKFKSLRVAGLRVVGPSSDRSVRAFNWSEGTTVALIGRLPGAVISADEGSIEIFTLNNGQDLLSSESRNHKPRSIDLSDDGTLLGFEVQSDILPKANAKSIKTLKGEIICMAAGSTKVTDLAFAKIESGEKSEHFGAEITKIEESKYNKGKKEISIRFDLERELIKEVKFYDKDGTQLKTRRNGYSWSGGGGRLTFLCDDSLSADCVIKIELYSDIKKHILPFHIKNAPLFPIKSKAE